MIFTLARVTKGNERLKFDERNVLLREVAGRLEHRGRFDPDELVDISERQPVYYSLFSLRGGSPGAFLRG